jgi:hypothetical protein
MGMYFSVGSSSPSALAVAYTVDSLATALLHVLGLGKSDPSLLPAHLLTSFYPEGVSVVVRRYMHQNRPTLAWHVLHSTGATAGVLDVMTFVTLLQHTPSMKPQVAVTLLQRHKSSKRRIFISKGPTESQENTLPQNQTSGP